MPTPVTAIEVYPTAEIHLLKSHPTPMRVVVREAKQYSEQNLLTQAAADRETKVLDFREDLIDVVKQNDFIEFIPKDKTGSTIARIRHIDSRGNDPVTSEVLVRIYVHEGIEEYWIGNNQVTIHRGEDNYVLSVYGYFSDGIIGDISCHRYIDFRSNGPEVLIDDNHDKGRITGVTPTHNGPVQLEAQIGNKSIQQVEAQVIDWIHTPKPILKCIAGSADVNNRENILFIAEGFKANQENVFNALAHNLSHRLLNGKDNSPFNLLKDRFNIWVAFEPSPEEGATVSRPVHVSLDLKERGKLLETDVNNDPLGQSDYYLLQAKDNRYGIAFGHRYGDQTSKQINGTPPNVNQWYVPGGSTRVSLKFDRRRLPRNWRASLQVNSYIDALRVNPNFHTGAQYANVQNIWKNTGKNARLVCWVVNDDLAGSAVRAGDISGLKFPAKQDPQINNIFFPGLPTLKTFDHTPRTLTLKTTPGLPSKVEGVNIPAITATLAHELGHSFGLGDEYETGSETTLSQNDTDNQERVEGYPNLTHFWQVKDGSNKIDLNKVVWNQWHRIRVSATLTQPAQSGTPFLQISPTSALFWMLYHDHIDQEVYIRTRDINFDHDNEDGNQKYISGPFIIDSINQVTGEIELLSELTRDFPAGSIVYAPKKQSNTTLSLIHPVVANFFNDPAGNNKEPFAKKDRALDECQTPNTDPSSAPAITTPSFAKANRQYIVALYEGGMKHNCNVYRPSGQCRMRDDDTLINKMYPEFCAVCKYHLVNKIDPEKLGDLDKEYPS